MKTKINLPFDTAKILLGLVQLCKRVSPTHEVRCDRFVKALTERNVTEKCLAEMLTCIRDAKHFLEREEIKSGEHLKELKSQFDEHRKVAQQEIAYFQNL